MSTHTRRLANCLAASILYDHTELNVFDSEGFYHSDKKETLIMHIREVADQLTQSTTIDSSIDSPHLDSHRWQLGNGAIVSGRTITTY